MIEHSAAYDAAITGQSRRTYTRVTADIVDPDLEITGVTASDEHAYSRKDQLINRGMEQGVTMASLEPGAWVLDGTVDLVPDTPSDLDAIGQYGWISAVMCDNNGAFTTAPYVELAMSGISLMPAVTVVFPSDPDLGVAADFTLAAYSGSSLLDSVTVSDNEDPVYVWEHAEASYPTKLRITISKWSVPQRCARVVFLMPGLIEQWGRDDVYQIDLYTEATFSCLALPYSTCTLEIYNEDDRFNPYSPDSIFEAIMARQALVVELGVRLEDGTVEYLPAGTYFQQSGGWAITGQNIRWQLVDIVGLLTQRNFTAPDTLPTTLGGWLSAMVSVLGSGFASRIDVDSTAAALALTVNSADDVNKKTCGELLRYACMATNTWPRLNVRTGHLYVGPLGAPEGNRITLDNMMDYATLEANDDIRDITFTLDSGEVTFPGSSTESNVSLRVDNPFIHTLAQAQKAVISALFEYGGKYFQVRHRGNPSSELGDIQMIDTRFRTSVAARLYKQQLRVTDGIMRDVPSYLIQSPTDVSGYDNKAVLTGSGTWTVPADVTKIKITVIGGGSGGRGGGGGVTKCSAAIYNMDDTAGGDGGDGGKVLIREVNVSAGQSFSYACGSGGSGGAGGAGVTAKRGKHGNDGSYGSEGGATTFGAHTSADGVRFENGLTDILTGAVYAQKGPAYNGVTSGLYGCGGIGGEPGRNGSLSGTPSSEHPGATTYEISSYATDGKTGGVGQPGCVIVEW